MVIKERPEFMSFFDTEARRSVIVAKVPHKLEFVTPDFKIRGQMLKRALQEGAYRADADPAAMESGEASVLFDKDGRFVTKHELVPLQNGV